MVNVFLTGSTGYLGSTFLLHAPKNWKITCYGRGKPSFPLPDNAEWIKGDLSRGSSAIHIPNDTDIVIHLASMKGCSTCIGQPAAAIMTNIAGTHHLLETAKNLDIEKIIFASTYWVYGENTHVPFNEQMHVAPTELYGLSKAVSEIEIRTSGIDHQILRFTNVFGRGSGIRPEEVVYHFIRAAHSGEPIRLEHGGIQEIDLIDVSDACLAIQAAVDGRTLHSGIINVGSGIPRSILSIGQYIQNLFQDLYGIHVPIISEEPHSENAIRRFVSVKKFQESFPHIKLKPFEDSVQTYIRQLEVSK